ncbi:FGFR1 oncogene partner 2 homolog [Diachasmimorpha longicaudata]|uniref:FGFR1 oncogene partner 2 homolog n=1 Tax=Diachasmimorpha longicaudata TaxID=58733 RepID=UPI0030B90421
MSLTFQQIICDARKLVGRITDHENTADNLITEIQSVCNQIDNMKQYQDEIDMLNAEAKQRPHQELITSIQQETRHLREIQAENKELKTALEDYQKTLELIMSKYRQQTSALMKTSKTDFSSLYNAKYANIITSQAEKINEMAAVMRVAASVDEESELKFRETFSRLKKENMELREILNITNTRDSLTLGPPHDHKTVQTEPE